MFNRCVKSIVILYLLVLLQVKCSPLALEESVGDDNVEESPEEPVPTPEESEVDGIGIEGRKLDETPEAIEETDVNVGESLSNNPEGWICNWKTDCYRKKEIGEWWICEEWRQYRICSAGRRNIISSAVNCPTGYSVNLSGDCRENW